MADREPRDPQDLSLTRPHSEPPGRATPENRKSDAETLGGGAGGFVGAVSGMALGAMGGPVGLVLGGLAGALGGWWGGKEIAEALTEDDDRRYRERYEASPHRLADRAYEDVRPAYVVGHLAARNPDYEGRSFEEIEPDLSRGWTDEVVARTGAWNSIRVYVREAYETGRAREEERR